MGDDISQQAPGKQDSLVVREDNERKTLQNLSTTIIKTPNLLNLDQNMWFTTKSVPVMRMLF